MDGQLDLDEEADTSDLGPWILARGIDEAMNFQLTPLPSEPGAGSTSSKLASSEGTAAPSTGTGSGGSAAGSSMASTLITGKPNQMPDKAVEKWRRNGSIKIDEA